MKQMGWKEGQGLGKHNDGIDECVQIQRRGDLMGLGFTSRTPEDQDAQWWTQIYETGLKSGSGRKVRPMGFVKSKDGLKSVGVLGQEEEDLTSDVSDEEDEPMGKGKDRKKAQELSRSERLKKKLQGGFFRFKRGEVLKPEFEENAEDEIRKEGEEENRIMEESGEEQIEEEEIAEKGEALENAEYVRHHFSHFFDCSSEYTKRDKKIFQKFVNLVSK